MQRPRLQGDLWPDSIQSDVLTANLSRLRKALGSESARLHVEGSTVWLDLHGAEVDYLRFQEAIEIGTAAALEEAVRLYRGELLYRHTDEFWIADLRDDLKTSFEDALKTLTELALSDGNHLIASRYLRRFVESNPDYEWGWVQLIDTYVQMGNTAEALATHAAYCAHLEEFGELPSPRVQEALARGHDEQQSLRVSEVRDRTEAPADGDGNLIAGGALHPTSALYQPRDADAVAELALSRPGATLRIKGPRQIGKSSLMARLLHKRREKGTLVLLTDWQNLPQESLRSAEDFYTTLSYQLADQADLDTNPTTVFREGLPPADNFDRFIRRVLVPSADRPIVWAIDEADRIFSCPFYVDVFAKLRAWHNNRALDPTGPWANFSIVLGYSTEAHLLIPNINQSPFNVGAEVALQDFTLAQASELNVRYGEPLAEAEVNELYDLVAGHPYLTSRAMDEARARGGRFSLRDEADLSGGVFADHLERMGFALRMDPVLCQTVRAFLAEGALPSTEHFLRLRSAGVVVGGVPAQMRLRCSLYERYLRAMLPA